MPIKKRLTAEERIKKQLPKGWRSALTHPLMKKQTYGVWGFDPTPKNIAEAIRLTKGWKGASFQQKLFVITLDLIMEKAFDRAVLEPDTYIRLQDHLESNQEKMRSESNTTWQTWCWDYYNDSYGLENFEAGTLLLETPIKRKLKKKPVTIKRRKIKPKKK